MGMSLSEFIVVLIIVIAVVKPEKLKSIIQAIKPAAEAIKKSTSDLNEAVKPVKDAADEVVKPVKEMADEITRPESSGEESEV